MGSFTDTARKLQSLEADLGPMGLRKIAASVGMDAKRDVLEEAARDLGPDRRMSGWGRFQFGAGYEVRGSSSVAISPRPAGPWVVLERGRRAKPGGIPKRRRTKVYRTPYGPRSASSARPWPVGRTRGHRTFTVAVRRISERTPQRVHDHTEAHLRRVFGR